MSLLFRELVRFLDRFDDFIVASATAQVAHHPILDFVFVGFGVFFQQRGGGNHLARSANAALKAAILDKALLDRVEFAVFRKTFHRSKIVAVRHDSEG